SSFDPLSPPPLDLHSFPTRRSSDLYLAHAEDLASRALAAYGSDPYYSGERGAYSGRSIFNAIFWRNLLLLYAVNKNQTYLQKMRSEEHTSEPSHVSISYAVFCLKKK